MSEISQDTRKASSSAIRLPTTLRIKKGQQVVCHGRAARVLVVVSPAQIWISFLGVKEHEWVSANALTPYAERDPTSTKKTVVSPEDEFEFRRASKWFNELDRFRGCLTLTPKVKEEIAKAMHATRRTVERHFESYQLDPSPQSQLPLKPGPESGSSYLQPAVIAIVDRAIDERYKTEERRSIQSVVELVGTRCAAAGLRSPSYNTVAARIQTLDRWEVARARHGRVRGDAIAGPAGEGVKGLKALDFVQMDHAIMDVIIVDPLTREEIGRPWITLAIDVATRCVLGFYITLDPPSQTSVALALENCCCPKDAWLKEIGYEGEWVPFGIMKTIGWDNAKCFKNTNLIAASKRNFINPLFRRIRTPVHGAHIERYIGTYMGRVHLLKGTTFSNTKDREDYKSGEKAVMTLSEIILWTVHEINGRYHNTRHSTLKRTPLEEWDSQWRKNGELCLPPIPADRRRFKLSLLPCVMRKVTREGVSRFGLKYKDESLIPLIGDKHKYSVSHDPRNISRIYLAYKDDYLEVPWQDSTRRPVALFELEKARHELREKHNTPISEATVFKHLEAMYELEEKAEKATRLQRRNRERRPPDDRPARTSAVVDYSIPSQLILNPIEVRRERDR